MEKETSQWIRLNEDYSSNQITLKKINIKQCSSKKENLNWF